MFFTKEILNADYEGRKIIILDDSKDINKNDLKKIEEEIVLFFKTSPIAKRFPKITIVLESHKHSIDYAWVYEKEIAKKEIVVYLNLLSIIKNKRIKFIDETIIHELIHVLNSFIVDFRKRRINQLARLEKVFQSSFMEILQTEPGIRDIRQSLLLFLHYLQNEGLAEFYGYYLTKRIQFNKKHFLRLYERSKKETEFTEKIWINYITGKKLTEKIWVSYVVEKKKRNLKKIEEIENKFLEGMHVLSYLVGMHMVYTLIYVNCDLNTKKLAKLSPQKFVKKYETAMKLKGLRPVVSLTSGDGILDYKRMVAEWWAIAKKIS